MSLKLPFKNGGRFRLPFPQASFGISTVYWRFFVTQLIYFQGKDFLSCSNSTVSKVAIRKKSASTPADPYKGWYVTTRNFRKGIDEFWPIPQSEIDINPNLAK